MRKHLEKIKQQPDHRKKKIAHIMAIISTGVLVLIYLFILALKPRVPQESSRDVAGPSLGDSVNTIFTNTVSEIAEVRKEFDDQPSLSEILQQAQEESQGNELQEIEAN